MADYSMYRFFHGEKECPEDVQRYVFVAFRDWHSATSLDGLWEAEADFDRHFREYDCGEWWSMFKAGDEKAAAEFMEKSESFYPGTDDSPSDKRVPERFKEWLFGLYRGIYVYGREGFPGAKPIYKSGGPWESLVDKWIFGSLDEVPKDRVFADTDIVHPLAKQWAEESAAM